MQLIICKRIIRKLTKKFEEVQIDSVRTGGMNIEKKWCPGEESRLWHKNFMHPVIPITGIFAPASSLTLLDKA